MNSYFGGHTKKGLLDLCGRKLLAKGARKLYRQVWRNSGKILHTPKNLSVPQGRTQGGILGLTPPPLEFAMLQKRHYLCKGVCVCFRTFFACLMSTYRKNRRMILHENFKEHCKWTKKK